MSIPIDQGQFLQVTVVRGDKLKDTEWLSRQDPYVSLDYGGTRFRTKRCTDGGKNPSFNENFVFPLIQGLRELKISVHNCNRLRSDDFIGSASIQLHKFFSQGYDNGAWPIYTEHGAHSGEIELTLKFTTSNVVVPQSSKKTHKSHAYKVKRHYFGGTSSHSESDSEKESQDQVVAEEVEEEEEKQMEVEVCFEQQEVASEWF